MSLRAHVWKKGIATVALALTASLGPAATPAKATDNVDVRLIHWHDKTMVYRLNTALPSAWKTSIASAALTWRSETRQGFSRGDETGSTDPNGADHIIWRGSIPSAWQDGCPPDSTVACNGFSFYQESYGSWHMSDSDIVFDANDAFGTGLLACPAEGLPGSRLDVETVALHEFGHSNALDHTTDSAAVMWPFVDECQRRLTSHDRSSMNRPYDNH